MPRAAEGMFDPASWDSVYGESRLDARNIIFRRSLERAYRICAEVSRPGETWLDVGCGPGHLTEKMRERGLKSIGVDQDPRMIAFAQGRFSASREENAPRFLEARADRLPLGEGTIDGAAAVSFTGCLTSVHTLFKETHRVLRKNGHFICTFANKESVLYGIDRWLHGVWNKVRSADDWKDYERYVFSEVRRELEGTGFTVIRTDFYNFFLPIKKWILPPLFLADALERKSGERVASRLARNFIILARKT